MYKVLGMKSGVVAKNISTRSKAEAIARQKELNSYDTFIIQKQNSSLNKIKNMASKKRSTKKLVPLSVFRKLPPAAKKAISRIAKRKKRY